MMKLNKGKIWKVTKFGVGMLIFCYFCFGSLLYFFQKNFVYYPSKQDFSSCPGFKDAEKISINGTRAYYKHVSGKLVVFYHGNGGAACDRSFIKDELEKLKVSYLFVEYAGYSNDAQKPSKKLIMQDAQNVSSFVTEKKYAQTIIVGESLGAAIAAYQATLEQSDKLLLISPFRMLADEAKIGFGIFPIDLLITENYDNVSYLRNTKAGEVEIVHGTNDDIIPFSQSKKLFSESGLNNIKFVEVTGAHHNDMYDFSETFMLIADVVRR